MDHKLTNIEGVVVAKKDFNLQKHDEIKTKNLYVIKSMQSLTSKGYVKTQFSWQHYYYTLTDDGADYLRNKLNLPSHVVPSTRFENTYARPQRQLGKKSGDGYRRMARD